MDLNILNLTNEEQTEIINENLEEYNNAFEDIKTLFEKRKTFNKKQCSNTLRKYLNNYCRNDLFVIAMKNSNYRFIQFENTNFYYFDAISINSKKEKHYAHNKKYRSEHKDKYNENMREYHNKRKNEQNYKKYRLESQIKSLTKKLDLEF